DLRLKLVQEEAADEAGGRLPIYNVSPSVFVIAGLDLEEQGYVIYASTAGDDTNLPFRRRIKVAVAAHKSESSKQSASVIEKRTKLSRNLARFRKVQAVYMPGALQALADVPVVQGMGTLAENVPLFLPSALSGELRASGCNKDVDGIELRLQDAQCRNALEEIRHYLYVKSRFWTYTAHMVRITH
ncbi:hypothetical protein B0H14DRAFT_2399411, partial [Mycena olivaceomarginata]